MNNEWRNSLPVKILLSRFDSIQYYQTEVHEVFSL